MINIQYCQRFTKMDHCEIISYRIYHTTILSYVNKTRDDYFTEGPYKGPDNV